MAQQSVKEIFEREKGKWHAKMTKIFGDHYPYNHQISHGLADDITPQEIVDSGETEAEKWDPFKKLMEVYEIEKKAEQEFNKILESVEDKTSASHLSEFLQERKRECAKIFEEFDKLVALCVEDFQAECAAYEKRQQEQMSILQMMLSEVEKYLSEVEEAGDKEIHILKDSIANYVYEIGDSWSSRINEIYEEMSNNPLTMEVWSNCSEAITSMDVRMAFLADQRETALLWKKAFEDLMMLSTELENYRYNYTLSKSNLERSILWMQKNLKDDMPQLTKMQREVSFMVKKKEGLEKELVHLERLIEKEEAKSEDIKSQYKERICAMAELNKQNNKQALVKYTNVFQIKKSEVLNLLQDVLNGDKYIFQIILNTDWKSPELSFLESENHPEEKYQQNSERTENTEDKHIMTLKDDEFAEAFRLLMSTRDLENLLNNIAEDLGYMLDFEWVNYVKKTLEIKNEIKWIELFKVFKIDFAEDLKALKDHMMNYSKRNDVGELIIDRKAVHEFLHFVELKRQQSSSEEKVVTVELPSENHEIIFENVKSVIPQIFLWDSVIELLIKYRGLLKSRGRLFTIKEELEAENSSLDKYLRNYYTFDMPG